MSKLSDATLRVLKTSIDVVESYGDELKIAHVGMVVKRFESLVKLGSNGKLDDCDEVFTREDLFLLASCGDVVEDRFDLAVAAAEKAVQS